MTSWTRWGTVAAVVLALAGCFGPEATIAGMTLSKGKTGGETSAVEFGTRDPVHCYVELANDGGGSKLRARVVAVEVAGVKPGEVVDSMERTTAKDEGPKYDLAYDEGHLKPGTYEFAVWLNAEADAGPASRTARFQVVADDTSGGSVADLIGAPGEDAGTVDASGTDEGPEAVVTPDGEAAIAPDVVATGVTAGRRDGAVLMSAGPFTEVYLTTEEDADSDRALVAFKSPVKDLWCHAVVRKPKPGQVVMVRWVAETVKGAKTNEVVQEDQVELKEGADWAQFHVFAKKNALPSGLWRVDLQVGESDVTQASLRFEIQ